MGGGGCLLLAEKEMKHRPGEAYAQACVDNVGSMTQITLPGGHLLSCDADPSPAPPSPTDRGQRERGCVCVCVCVCVRVCARTTPYYGGRPVSKHYDPFFVSKHYDPFFGDKGADLPLASARSHVIRRRWILLSQTWGAVCSY